MTTFIERQSSGRGWHQKSPVRHQLTFLVQRYQSEGKKGVHRAWVSSRHIDSALDVNALQLSLRLFTYQVKEDKKWAKEADGSVQSKQ